MTEGLREFDDSIGKCCHCRKLVFKTENWVIPFPYGDMKSIAHRECNAEFEGRASQI